jgi:preprotein translocase subunit SecF
VIDFIKYSKLFIVVSLVAIALGIYGIVSYGLKLSIEYTGGSVISLKNYESVSYIENIVSKKDIEIKEINEIDGLLTLKLNETSNEKLAGLQKELTSNQVTQIEDFEIISPSYGAEFAKNSLIGVLLSLIVVVLFMAYSFYKVSGNLSPWSFGIAALVAMLHDILITTSLFSFLGHFNNVEIDALFLTAILTIIGFSINDTIVVFDRIRENLNKYQDSKSLSEICNISIFETFNRSLTTSFTVVIIMFSLFTLGSGSIKYFSLALVVGLTAGTYSSIFIATPLLLIVNKYLKK